MKNKKILAIIMAITMVSGTVALSGCGTEGKSAYDIWLEQGNTGTEQDFLNSLKGNGEKGKSAYDIWLEQGNTGTEQDFLNSLKGTPGTPGQPGERGNKITKGEGAPTVTEGAIEGDMYVDTKEWNVYFFESGEWKDYGSIKGMDDSEESPQYKVVKDFGKMTINTEGVPLDLGEVNNGTYFLVVESDSEAVANNLTSVIGGSHKYDMYCPLTKGYKSVVVKGDSTTLSLKATQSVTGNVKLVEYTAPTIKADETYEIPITHSGYCLLKFNIAPELIGHKVKLEVKFYCKLYQLQFRYWETGKEQFISYGSVSATGDTEYSVVKEIDVVDNTEAICIGSSFAKTHCNGTVTVTLAD